MNSSSQKTNYVLKLRIYPNSQQKDYLSKCFGCARWIYNNGLAKSIEQYKQDKTFLWYNDLAKQIPKLKKSEETKWLKEVDSTSLQQSLKNLDKAFKNFCKNKGHFGFPKFKSKSNKQSIKLTMNIDVDLDNNKIKIPKCKPIKCISDKRRPNGRILSVTISKTPTEKYFASILYEIEKVDSYKELDLNKSIGIDFGLKTFLTLSNGEKIQSPQYFKISKNKLARLSKKHSRKKTNSKNKEKSRIKLAKIHEKIANQRKDFNHKLSRHLVNNYDFIFIEDLSLNDMIKKFGGRKINDLSYNQLCSFISYKMDTEHKHVIKLNRYFPSSKLCSNCGFKNDNLQLKDREWICPNCGCCHDRDLNAAINLLNEGLKHLTNTVGSTEINACPNSNELKTCKFTDYEEISPYNQWRVNKQELKLN